LIAALRVLAVMLRTGEPLSVLRRVLRKFPQVTQALKVREKRHLSHCPSLTAAIQELEARLGEAGRVLVRYSGTEPKLRLLVEAASDAEAAQGLAALEAAAKHDLAVL
jgi:phosphoglucosamine mutase